MTKERAISHLKDISMWGIIQADEYNALKMAIEELQKKPRVGKWKTQKLQRSELTYCSECGFGKHIDDERNYNYCPICGCRISEVMK